MFHRLFVTIYFLHRIDEIANLIQKCRSRIESQICYLLGISGIMRQSK